MTACKYAYRYNYMEDGMAELQRDMLRFEAGFQRLRDQLPKRMLWRESTAQHFNTTSGVVFRGSCHPRLYSGTIDAFTTSLLQDSKPKPKPALYLGAK